MFGVDQYVLAKDSVSAEEQKSPAFRQKLLDAVRAEVGSFAAPDFILITRGLPKTRSGKIMRRVLRKIACQETAGNALGDTSTLADPSVVDTLIKEVEELLRSRNIRSAL